MRVSSRCQLRFDTDLLRRCRLRQSGSRPWVKQSRRSPSPPRNGAGLGFGSSVRRHRPTRAERNPRITAADLGAAAQAAPQDSPRRQQQQSVPTPLVFDSRRQGRGTQPGKVAGQCHSSAELCRSSPRRLLGQLLHARVEIENGLESRVAVGHDD